MKLRLARYAEFIHATTSYVVLEALNRIFVKDHEFKAWLQQQTDKVFQSENKMKSAAETREEPRNAT